MKHKFFALFTVGFLILNLFGAAFADAKTKKVKKQNGSLVSLLPASDGVFKVEINKLMNNALPQILSGNQPLLSKMTKTLDDVRDKTGIDLRQFEQAAVGVSMVKVKAKEYDFKPVVLARGQYNADALVSLVKLASNGKYREEKIGTKTVYIFSAKETIDKNKPQTTDSGAIDRMVDGLTGEIALTSLDTKTLAFGTLARVRQTIEAKTAVADDVLNLLNRNPNATMAFAGKVPGGMDELLPLDNDEFGKNIGAIRYLSGSMDVAGDSANVQLFAKTATNAQAEEMFSMLQGLQMVGKSLLDGLKGEDKKVYARMVENAKMSRNANEIALDLSVPQSDIDVLIPMIKIK